MSDIALKDFFAQWIPLVEAEMQRVVDARVQHATQPSIFNTMLKYHLGFANADGSAAHINAGKRIRPMLVLLSCAACGGNPELALPAAAAVELLHNFSLIHDDIEDGDELRRGRPTLWKHWGVPQAINSGDAMFAQAHLALLGLAQRGVPSERVVRAQVIFDDMCVHLTIGQHMDIGFETRNDVSAADYMTMIEGKTAALIRACCEIGAVVAGADEATVKHLGEFGRCVGLSFQLQDDVLGIWGDPAVTGKKDGDLANRKKTLPVLFAADHDPHVRALYFGDSPLSAEKIAWLKNHIEASGGRTHTEQAAERAYFEAMEGWSGAELNNSSGTALRELAHSLLGRAA